MNWTPKRRARDPAIRGTASAVNAALIRSLYWFAIFMPAEAAAQAASRPAPALTVTRYDEDWSVLEDPKVRQSVPLGDLKFIPLGPSGEAWLTTGIELRLRNEKFTDNLWGSSPAPDDGYLLLRAMPYADVHVGRARAFVELIAADAVGVKPSRSPVDATGVDILQAFGEVRLGSSNGVYLALRGGREMLSLGSQRLVGTRYGPNVPLAFDGARAMLRAGRLELDLLYVHPVQSRPGNFDDRTSARKALWSVYATRTLPVGTGSGLDIYYIGYRNDGAVFDQGTGREIRHSIGARLFGTAHNWHWNWEGIYQFGRFGTNRIAAWGAGMETGRKFPAAPLKPDVLLRVGVASGDRSPQDHILGTFNALFPKGKYFGELSPVGPYNILSAQPGLTLSLRPDLSFGLVGMFYWRQSRSDGIYDVPGNLIRSGRASRARFVGREVELTLAWSATRTLTLAGSLSAFEPGAFIRETGPGQTIVMVGLESNFLF